MHQEKERGSLGGLWKGIWHPLCQNASLQFQHGSAFYCPNVTTACPGLQLDSALCFSLQTSPPACIEHPRAHLVSWGGIIMGAGSCKQLHGDTRLPFPCPACFGDRPIRPAGQTIRVGAS